MKPNEAEEISLGLSVLYRETGSHPRVLDQGSGLQVLVESNPSVADRNVTACDGMQCALRIAHCSLRTASQQKFHNTICCNCVVIGHWDFHNRTFTTHFLEESQSTLNLYI
jgi:hypothetical protein